MSSSQIASCSKNSSGKKRLAWGEFEFRICFFLIKHCKRDIKYLATKYLAVSATAV